MILKKGKFILALLCMSLTTTGCPNVLKETAKTDTPDAVFYQAKLEMNNRNYLGAIGLLQTLGPTYLAQRHVAIVYASAFSGRCGLDFVSFVQNLENVGSATSIFSYLMGEYPGATDPQIADCLFSESILNSLGDFTTRTDDENILMGLSSLTKVGTVLSRYADADGDGSPDAGFDHCDLTDLPDDAVREIGTGVAQAILSVSQVASDITSDALTEISDLCNLSPSLNAFCTNTDKNAYSAIEVAAFRAILGSTDAGIGSCPGGFVACVCP